MLRLKTRLPYALSRGIDKSLRHFGGANSNIGNTQHQTKLSQLKNADQVLQYFGIANNNTGASDNTISPVSSIRIPTQAEVDAGVNRLAKMKCCHEAKCLIDHAALNFQIYPSQVVFHKLLNALSGLKVKQRIFSSSSSSSSSSSASETEEVVYKPSTLQIATRHANNQHLLNVKQKQNHHHQVAGEEKFAENSSNDSRSNSSSSSRWHDHSKGSVQATMLNILEHMRKSPSSLPDVETYNLMLRVTFDELKHVLSSKYSQTTTDNRVDEILHQMSQDGVKPNKDTLNTVYIKHMLVHMFSRTCFFF
jgi:hypothetical protein